MQPIPSSERRYIPSCNLSQFMNGIISTENSNFTFTDSKSAKKIHDVVQHETLTEPIIATFFWQIISHTQFFKNNYLQYKHKINPGFVSPLDLKPEDGPEVNCFAKPMVVPHGTDAYGARQYSMLILVPGLDEKTPHILSANHISRNDLETGFKSWFDMNVDTLEGPKHSIFNKFPKNQTEINRLDVLRRLFLAVEPDFIYSILDKIRMTIVFNRAPEEIPTDACFNADPCHSVLSSYGEKSTAGIYGYRVVNENGIEKEIFGVTICRHAMLRFAFQPSTVMDQSVSINGINGIVISEDPISDSCFVALDQTLVKGIIPLSGPLQILPDPNKRLSFEGASSGKKQASLMPIGWDAEILTPHPLIQKRICTQPITNPGDSRAALYNDEGKVLGFSFSRTGANANPEYSSWIWADSVFQIHQLKI